MLELARIDGRKPQVGGIAEFDPDVLAERAAHQRFHAGQQFAQVGRARLQHLAAPEGEQPARQVGAAFGRHPHRLGERTQLVVEQAGEHIGVEQDGGQQIVEVMRDPAGELAERFDPLCLRELDLDLLLLGDVGHHEADTGRLAARVEDRKFHQQGGSLVVLSCGVISRWITRLLSTASRSSLAMKSASSLG